MNSEADRLARIGQELAAALVLLRGQAGAAPAAPAPAGEPIRTVHHFACTGGTLISKCIASMPNVQLLSEVDPLSEMQLRRSPSRFAPTDMITLLHQSSRGVQRELLLRVFQASLQALWQDCSAHGLRLVLRDHAHSHFCTGDEILARPTLREMVVQTAPVRSLLTVRHPVDSMASVQKNFGLHFEPASLDGYCRRYLAFLDRHAGVPIIRYEDFVLAPQETMQSICAELHLPFFADFQQVFPGIVLSGDSGRRSDVIGLPERRPEALALYDEARQSEAFALLCQRLGYTLEATVPAS